MTTPASCPRCGQNDRVVTLEAPVQRRGEALVDAASAWPYECCRCVLVFRGTDAEWVRMTEDRQKYRQDHGGRTRPPGGSAGRMDAGDGGTGESEVVAL